VSTRAEATRDRVEEQLASPLRDLGLDLEALELTPAGRRRLLRVAVDKDGGVTSDDLAEATRAVSDALDASDVMGEQPYTLEVTSRGVDRPLTLPRHWRRNVGRLVSVTRADGERLTGRLVDADEEPAGGATIEPEEGGRPAGDPVEVGYADVARALVQVELNRREGDA
jgi:ribosome maturation factor RimP